MAKPGLRPLTSAENRKTKYELIYNAHKRIAYSISKGFHLEAIAITESLLADRLESAIHSVNPEYRMKNTLGALINKALSMEIIQEDFAEELRCWHNARSKLIHEMVKLSEDVDSSWEERLKFARHTSQSGLSLIKELDKTSKAIKKTEN